MNILIGSDHHWEFVTGNVMRGVCEPTAIKTKFGWVLSGPVQGISSEPSVANFVSSHVLQLDASPDTTDSETNLDMRLKMFWDLESLGINSSEPLLYEKLVQLVLAALTTPKTDICKYIMRLYNDSTYCIAYKVMIAQCLPQKKDT